MPPPTGGLLQPEVRLRHASRAAVRNTTHRPIDGAKQRRRVGPKRPGHFGLRAYVETTDARNESYWQGLAHEAKSCCISAAFSGVLDDLPGSRTILPTPFRVSNRRALGQRRAGSVAQCG